MSTCKITDLHGDIHTLDFDNLHSDYINVDCMEALKQMPDKCVDIAVVDPPYGDCGGGMWDSSERGRFGGLFNKYRETQENMEPFPKRYMGQKVLSGSESGRYP